MKTSISILSGLFFLMSGVINVYASFDADANQAIGKNVVASPGNAAAAVDGDKNTRWESEFTDDQWWYMDLATPMNLSRIEILWEGAYGKHIMIQTAMKADAGEIIWTDAVELDRTLDDISVPEEIVLNVPARYVRMLGVERALPYGYSFFEFRVFASSEYSPVEKPKLSSVVIDDIEVIEGESASINMYALNQTGGIYTDVIFDFSISDETAAIIVESGGQYVVNALRKGNHTITATAHDEEGNHVSASASLFIKDSRALASVEIESEYEVGIVGVGMKIVIEGKDQYGDPYSIEGVDWIASSGTILDGVFTPSLKGEAIIKAISSGVESNELRISTIASGDNVALNKSIVASSSMEGASNIVDGDYGSRWISPQPGDDQQYEAYITLDLGSEYSIDLIDIYWEGACPADYKVFYSGDNNDFGTEVYSINDMQGMASVHKYHYGSDMKTRYITVLSTRAATIYGVSMWEMSVYSSSEVTSIDEVGCDESIMNKGLYDLNGRFIRDAETGDPLKDMPNGIYIINGKKILLER